MTTAATAENRSTLVKSAAIASVGTAIALLFVKAWATQASGSSAMLASFGDTVLDLVASVATLVAVRYAAQPADAEHRFGHGKAEALAAIMQVMLVSVAATAIAGSSILELASGAPVSSPAPAVAASLVAIGLTLALIAWQGFVVRRTGSVAIKADSLHYRADLLLNGAVIVALAAQSVLGIAWLDPLFGLGIAAWLGWGAFQAAGEAVDHLLDREWDDEQRAKLIAIVAQHEGVSNLHDLRTRTSGTVDFAQFHIDMPGHLTVHQSHDIIDAIEADLAAAFPGSDIIIHVDPEGHVDEPDNPLREADEFDNVDYSLVQRRA